MNLNEKKIDKSFKLATDLKKLYFIFVKSYKILIFYVSKFSDYFLKIKLFLTNLKLSF